MSIQIVQAGLTKTMLIEANSFWNVKIGIFLAQAYLYLDNISCPCHVTFVISIQMFNIILVTRWQFHGDIGAPLVECQPSMVSAV